MHQVLAQSLARDHEGLGFASRALFSQRCEHLAVLDLCAGNAQQAVSGYGQEAEPGCGP